MSYYKILGMNKEPFSTSPDPEFFYLSAEHKAAFYRLRIAIELSADLASSWQMSAPVRLPEPQTFSGARREPNVITAMILNPIYDSQEHFLQICRSASILSCTREWMRSDFP
jgi:hypothetical protein